MLGEGAAAAWRTFSKGHWRVTPSLPAPEGLITCCLGHSSECLLRFQPGVCGSGSGIVGDLGADGWPLLGYLCSGQPGK
jgi:hypothetical protein